MINNEYLTVVEISKEYKVTTRNIRRIISELVKVKSKELLYKDQSGQWRVHRILLSYFKPKRVKKQQYYGLTVDPSGRYSSKDIDEIMMFVLEKMDNPNIEINYVVEQKKANGKNHLHCFINCNQKKKLIENLRLGFSNIGYHQTDIFDLERWKQYITKDGGQIKTLKN
jgi:hypothetical protein